MLAVGRCKVLPLSEKSHEACLGKNTERLVVSAASDIHWGSWTVSATDKGSGGGGGAVTK